MTKSLIFRAIVLATLVIIVAIVLFGNLSGRACNIRTGLALEPARVEPDAVGIFGLAQLLSTLALFVAIFNVSDFRYRYRVYVWPLSIRTIGIWAVISIGIILILVEFWFQNHLPIPYFLNFYANLKLVLAGVFAALVVIFISACFVWPVRFGRTNARRFFNVTSYYIHQGNADRLQAIAEELSPAMRDIFISASRLSAEGEPAYSTLAAHDVMLILADRRFCHVVVDRVPGFALECFRLAVAYPDVPFADFAHFIGHEFIANTNSAFYQEDVFGSGYSRHAKPISKVVFGNYELVERCASTRWSPLEADYRKTDGVDEQRIEGFYQAATSFVDAYLETTRGRQHSYAFARLLQAFGSLASLISTSEGTDGAWYRSSGYAGLSHSMQFIAFVVEKMDKLNIKPSSLREKTKGALDPYDGLAELFYQAVFHAGFVTQPEFKCWDIQHNVVWGGQRDFYRPSKARATLSFKIRRKLYDKIREMDRFPNFEGARILGFCLNVFGLQPIDRHNQLYRADYALQRVVLYWTKRNFRKFAEEYPNLLSVCLHGFISYDRQGQRLVQASGNKIKQSPNSLFFFQLD